MRQVRGANDDGATSDESFRDSVNERAACAFELTFANVRGSSARSSLQVPRLGGRVPPVVVAPVLVLHRRGGKLRGIQIVQARDVDGDVILGVPLRLTDEAVRRDAAVFAEAAVHVAAVVLVATELLVAGDGPKILRLRAHAPPAAF